MREDAAAAQSDACVSPEKALARSLAFPFFHPLSRARFVFVVRTISPGMQWSGSRTASSKEFSLSGNVGCNIPLDTL